MHTCVCEKGAIYFCKSRDESKIVRQWMREDDPHVKVSAVGFYKRSRDDACPYIYVHGVCGSVAIYTFCVCSYVDVPMPEAGEESETQKLLGIL